MATDVRAVLIKLVGKNETKKAFASINKSLAGIKRGIAQMGKFTVAAGSAAGVLANMGAEFSIKMAEVNTMLDDSGQTVAMFKKEILALSKETGKAPLELAEALRQTLSAGVDAGDAMQFLRKSTKAAIGGVAETVEAVDLATNAMNAFGKETLKVDRILDVTQQTVKFGKTTMTELAESMGVLFQPAAKIGLSFEEINAAMATLTKGGVKTSIAVTQLRALMVTLLKPTSDAKAAAKELGIEFTAAALKSKGLKQFLNELKTATEGNDEAIARLFPNVRGMASVFSLAGNQADEFETILVELKNATGASGEAFEKVSKDEGFKFRKSLNSIKVAAVEVGVVLLPIINEVVQDSIKWVKQNEALAKSIAAVTAALVLLKVTGIAPIIVSIGQLLIPTVVLIAKTAILAKGVLVLAASYGALKVVILGLLAPVVFIGAKIAAVAAAGFAAGRGIAFLIEKFAPEVWDGIVNSIVRVGEALGVFEKAITQEKLDSIGAESAERVRKNRENEKNNPSKDSLEGESREDGENIGAHLRMAVKENNEALKNGILDKFRSTNTQLAGATLAGGNGI